MSIFKYVKNFGLSFSFKRGLYGLLYKMTKNAKYKDLRFKNTLKYLDKHFGNLLQDSENEDQIKSDFKVFVFWAQGFENAPEIVKACVSSIKENFKNHDVVLIDNSNFKTFVNIPDYILKKVENKTISLTHFSDILRVCLLEKYGGVWIDATCYLTAPISHEITKYSFYSNKLNNNSSKLFVSKGRWSAFFLCSNKGNQIITNLKNLFFEYWKTHDTLIEYYLIDYAITLQYSKFENIKKAIDEVPENNPEIHTLSSLLFETFDKKIFNDICFNTSLYKLSYKFDPEKTKLDNTFYRHIIKK